MIDVPIRVKDALREGDRLKRYRFVVEDMPQEIWTDITDYEESTSGGRVTRTYSLSSGTYKFTAGEYMLEVWYREGGSQIATMVESHTSKEIAFDASISVRAIYRVDDDCLVQKQGFESLVITNENLVSESVIFDERMCSDKEIKFGLCEGTNLEFQYFGLPNITGKRLQAFIDVQYKDSDNELKWYEIPMGWFTVDESSRQASTGIIKVSAYNKLLSDYLDNKANSLIEEMFSDPTIPVHVIDVEQNLLGEYGIKEEERERVPQSVLIQSFSYHPITTIKAVVQYGIENPFNYFQMGGNTNYLWVHNERPHYRLNPNKAYRISCDKDFEQYESIVYSMLAQLFGWANLDKTGSQIMEEFVVAHSIGEDYTYQGFQDVIGICLTMEDDTVEYYSTIQFNKNQSLVSGTWADLSKKIITGCKDLQINLVRSVFASPSASDLSINTTMPMWGVVHQYGYYDTPNHAVVGSFPDPIRYPDGEVIEYQDLEQATYFHLDEITNLSPSELIEITPLNLPDVTLRDLQSASFETVCQYGKLDRETDLFSGVELNNSRLLPAEDLYPANDLYPMSMAERSNPAMYSKLWADEGNVRKFRYLIITYKTIQIDQQGNPQEVEKTLQRTVDEHGTDNYNMSDNWLFRNLIWTDEQIGEYADAMVLKMQNLTWFPFEMWCAGLPYIETGDELEINVAGESYTSYVLRRSLKGILNLQDEMVNGMLDIF